MQIPAAVPACQEKLVPGVEVLWPQRERSNDSTCLSDLTPEQSGAEQRAAKVDDGEIFSGRQNKTKYRGSFQNPRTGLKKGKKK